MAAELAPEHKATETSVYCAKLVSFGGEVEILDSSRKNLALVAPKMAVPCGAWVSVGKGWAFFVHEGGYKIQVGQSSFFQFNLNGEDHVTLFRGLIYAKSEGGNGEIRVMTPNARARIQRATGLILFNENNQESQLISLENSSSLENRFQNSRAIVAKEGEATSLNFKSMRVVPSTPRAVSLASAKEKFSELHLDDDWRMHYLKALKKRQDRKFASSLGSSHPQRKTASHGSYERHRSYSNSGKVQKEMNRKIAGGNVDAEKLMYPEKTFHKPQHVEIEIENFHKTEDVEKKKLIEDLSQIRGE